MLDNGEIENDTWHKGVKGCRDKGLKGEEKNIISEEAGNPALYPAGVSDVRLAQQLSQFLLVAEHARMKPDYVAYGDECGQEGI